MNLRKSVLATLAYHDIFDYPLNIDEIEHFLIENKSEIINIERTLKIYLKLNLVGETEGQYFLSGRKDLIRVRKKRTKYSKDKFKKAKFYLNFLKIIPSIRLVALTGALAMNNSTQDDDIDFLIISSKKTLWTTRFFTNLVLFPYKRKPLSRKQKDKACLNIFIDESDLKIQEQNLYTAHEIAQLNPIFNRSNSYAKFILANNWIHEYLPNWRPKVTDNKFQNKIRKKKEIKIYQLIEKGLKKLQLSYMKSKITSEKIGDSQLFFHPKRTQTEILDSYNRRLKKLKIFDKL